MAGLVKRAKRSWRRAGRKFTRSVADALPPGPRRVLSAPAAYLSMLFVDHGIFRLAYLNAHRLSGKTWRAAQPAPHQIRRFARKGVRTIVNLRGARECGSYWLETRACEQAGVKLVNFQVRSRAAPSLEELKGAARLFNEIEYPALLHCKSGADRAGLMSVLYQHLHEGVPMAEAKKQLSLKFGHIRQAQTGILDYFFERYLADSAETPMDFFTWVDTVYDPDELKASFQAKGWANRLVDSILRRE
ncbi:protein tyrosine phosphatase [Hyphomicrobium sulfonivorans]|nr:tyrosine-protein phosphatase [Hyphomicrobium sulfonivorans]NSL72503.1 protein tyrosine phosphatase [Hyphomicrobium sulfonivorans]